MRPLPMPPALPRPAFRIGIIGAPGPCTPAQRDRLCLLLGSLRSGLLRGAAAGARARLPDRDRQPPLLRIVLDAGCGAAPALPGIARAALADDLSGHALALRLEAVLPHPAASLELGEAVPGEEPPQRLFLDGRPGTDGRTARNVGRMVMRNCDLLVVLCPAIDPGTEDAAAQMLRFAVRFGPDVLWIPADDTEPPALLEDLADLARHGRVPDQAKQGEAAWARVAETVAAAQAPPDAPHPHPHGLLERGVLWLRGLFGRPTDPYDRFLGETDHQGGGLWGFYAWARGIAAGAGRQATAGQPAAPGEEGGYWQHAQAAPDRLSGAYAARYRSITLLVILLIAAALICAVVALTLPPGSHGKLWVGIGECFILLLIAYAVGWTIWGDWQAKWVSYRLLAELCRKQEALARFGWSLPVLDVGRATRAGPVDGGWVAWHVNALMRAAPWAGAQAGAAYFSPAGNDGHRRAIIGREDDGAGLLGGQIAYHARRSQTGMRAAQCWAFWGELAFLATLFCVVMKLATKHWIAGTGSEVLLGLSAAVLPAVSAGFFALRAYSEERLLAEQSALMADDLREARRLMEAVDTAQPLSSQDLAALTADVTARMLQDVAGWAQLVRVKVVEAG